MPEGPEVRKYADALSKVLTGNLIRSFEARTRAARQWLQANEGRLIGRRVNSVFSHGKHLVGRIENGFFFHSHLMMWGRWLTIKATRRTKIDTLLPDRDRRERARIVTNKGAALLLSAPIFNVGKGDPYRQIEVLRTLGPDVLPYRRKFDQQEFRRRLLKAEHKNVAIGAALLNQQIAAGLGNYLRAEILFACKINPWRLVRELREEEFDCLSRTIPKLARRAYRQTATASERDRKRMADDPTLVYQPGREYGTRHLVFRRTNLPCLRCGQPIRQLRQKTYSPEPDDENTERTRIIYFCPQCQRVDLNDVKSAFR